MTRFASYKNKTTALVCGGFTVCIVFSVHAAEPDVGYMHDYCEVESITTERGDACPWLEQKFTATDREAIDIAMYESAERDDGY